MNMNMNTNYIIINERTSQRSYAADLCEAEDAARDIVRETSDAATVCTLPNRGVVSLVTYHWRGGRLMTGPTRYEKTSARTRRLYAELYA